MLASIPDALSAPKQNSSLEPYGGPCLSANKDRCALYLQRKTRTVLEVMCASAVACMTHCSTERRIPYTKGDPEFHM